MKLNPNRIISATVVGPLAIYIAEGKICRLELPSEIDISRPCSLIISPSDRLIADQAILELDDYLAGKRQTFNVPFDVHAIPGTDFQKRVWERLLRIPYGSTCTYGQIAQEIGSPKACRAVGQAVHCNPLPILVPCHRVVAANGQIGGFRGDLNLKRFLLNLEREHKTKPREFGS